MALWLVQKRRVQGLEQRESCRSFHLGLVQGLVENRTSFHWKWELGKGRRENCKNSH